MWECWIVFKLKSNVQPTGLTTTWTIKTPRLIFNGETCIGTSRSQNERLKRNCDAQMPNTKLFILLEEELLKITVLKCNDFQCQKKPNKKPNIYIYIYIYWNSKKKLASLHQFHVHGSSGKCKYCSMAYYHNHAASRWNLVCLRTDSICISIKMHSL